MKNPTKAQKIIRKNKKFVSKIAITDVIGDTKSLDILSKQLCEILFVSEEKAEKSVFKNSLADRKFFGIAEDEPVSGSCLKLQENKKTKKKILKTDESLSITLFPKTKEINGEKYYRANLVVNRNKEGVLSNKDIIAKFNHGDIIEVRSFDSNYSNAMAVADLEFKNSPFDFGDNFEVPQHPETQSGHKIYCRVVNVQFLEKFILRDGNNINVFAQKRQNLSRKPTQHEIDFAKDFCKRVDPTTDFEVYTGSFLDLLQSMAVCLKRKISKSNQKEFFGTKNLNIAVWNKYNGLLVEIYRFIWKKGEGNRGYTTNFFIDLLNNKIKPMYDTLISFGKECAELDLTNIEKYRKIIFKKINDKRKNRDNEVASSIVCGGNPNKIIVGENLEFQTDTTKSRTSNKRSANFRVKTLLNKIEEICEEKSLRFSLVNPAYTSVHDFFDFKFSPRLGKFDLTNEKDYDRVYKMILNAVKFWNKNGDLTKTQVSIIELLKLKNKSSLLNESEFVRSYLDNKTIVYIPHHHGDWTYSKLYDKIIYADHRAAIAIGVKWMRNKVDFQNQQK